MSKAKSYKGLTKIQQTIYELLVANHPNKIETSVLHQMLTGEFPDLSFNSTARNCAVLHAMGRIRKTTIKADAHNKKRSSWSFVPVLQQQPKKTQTDNAQFETTMKNISGVESRVAILEGKFKAIDNKLDDFIEELEKVLPDWRALRRDLNTLEGKLNSTETFAKTHTHMSDTAQLIINAKKAGAKNVTIEL